MQRRGKKFSHLIHCTYGPIYTDASYANKQTKNKNPKTAKKYETKKWSGFKKIEIIN